MKGLAPRRLSPSMTVRVIQSMAWIPRLPTATAIRLPARIRDVLPSRRKSPEISPGMSPTRSPGNFWRTETMRGSGRSSPPSMIRAMGAFLGPFG